MLTINVHCLIGEDGKLGLAFCMVGEKEACSINLCLGSSSLIDYGLRWPWPCCHYLQNQFGLLG